jgi:hypothetical protein
MQHSRLVLAVTVALRGTTTHFDRLKMGVSISPYDRSQSYISPSNAHASKPPNTDSTHATPVLAHPPHTSLFILPPSTRTHFHSRHFPPSHLSRPHIMQASSHSPRAACIRRS